jgi:hypothetical protein
MMRDIFPIRSRLFILKVTVLAATMGACPCLLTAQRHGGGSAGGGGLNSGGRATGVNTKDDLKDFHEALAIQATSQQAVDYSAMVKSAAEAYAELQTLLEQLQKKNDAAALGARGAGLEQSLEKARTENKAFVGGFSGPQKSGLKEVTKKLTKADSELEQRSQELNRKIAETTTIEGLTSSAQNLERALTNFQTEQANLGEEMGIVNPDSEDVAFDISPVKNSVSFQGQRVAIFTSGVISKDASAVGQKSFRVKLTEDFSDLQQNFMEVMRTQLDKADRCGERLAVSNATLTPMTPATLVMAQFHFERWTCMGGENEIAESDGTLEVKLTPAVAEDGSLKLTPVITRIEAEGLLGESLRSGSLGSDLRDKIMDAVLSTLQQGSDFKKVLPPAAQGSATLRHAQFQSTGAGSLTAVVDGDIRISDDKATAMANELKARSALPSLQR